MSPKPPVRASSGRLSPDEVARLSPHVERRRLELRLAKRSVLPMNTYLRLGDEDRPAQSIGRITASKLDERLGWTPGTALDLAEGRINSPRIVRTPAPPADGEDGRDRAYAYLGRLTTTLQDVPAEDMDRITELLKGVWQQADEARQR